MAGIGGGYLLLTSGASGSLDVPYRGVDGTCSTYQNGWKPSSPKSSPFSLTPPSILSRHCSILDIDVIFVISLVDLGFLRLISITDLTLPPVCASRFSIGIVFGEPAGTKRLNAGVRGLELVATDCPSRPTSRQSKTMICHTLLVEHLSANLTSETYMADTGRKMWG